MNHTTRPGKRKTLTKALIISLALLAAGLMVVSLFINPIARTQINFLLENFISRGSALGDIDIQLTKGKIRLSGLKIYPPREFGVSPLFQLKSLDLKINPWPIFQGEIIVENLVLTGGELLILRDKNGLLNTVSLITGLNAEIESTTEHGVLDQQKEEQPSFGAQLISSITVKAIALNNFSISLEDQGKNRTLHLAIDFAANNLYINGLSGRNIQIGDLQLKEIALNLMDHTIKDEWQAGFKALNLDITGLNLLDISKKEIAVKSFALDLKGVSADQPAGFGNGKMIILEHASLSGRNLNLGSKKIFINRLLVNKFSSSLAVNKEGVSNLGLVKLALLGETEQNQKTEQNITMYEKSPPELCIKKIQIRNGSIDFKEELFTNKALNLPLDKIDLEITGLRMFSQNKDADPASASLSFEINQPGDLPVALFGGLAALGSLGQGPPLANVQARLTGFNLDTIDPLVPSATRTALGAEGFDAGLAMVMDRENILLESSLMTDQNSHYDAVTIKGPLGSAKITTNAVLSGVFTRVSDGLLNMGKKGLGAGAGIVKSGAGLAKGLGSSTFKLSKNLGQNVFEITEGLISLDHDQVQQGLKGTTKDTVHFTRDSASGASSVTGEGIKHSMGKLKGMDLLKNWEDKIPLRHDLSMDLAQKELSEMVYPPAIDLTR